MDTEYSKLAKAVFSVERLASGFLKRFFCDFILRLYVSLGLDPPDFSYGDGQIKISTLRRTHSDYVKDAPEAAKPKLTNLLLDHCVALEVAVNILRDEMTIHADPSGLLPRSEIARAAKTWNGQASSNSVEGAIANARYRELVYQTFIALRFFTTASGEESPR